MLLELRIPQNASATLFPFTLSALNLTALCHKVELTLRLRSASFRLFQEGRGLLKRSTWTARDLLI